MTITWWGKTYSVIESDQNVLVINPPPKKLGLKGPKKPVDAIVFSEPTPPRAEWKHLVGDRTIIIDTPGEYDVRGFFIFGLSGSPSAPTNETSNAKGGVEKKEPNLILVETERRTIAHLAHYPYESLAEEDLERIEDVDILLISVGGDPNGKTQERIEAAIDAERAVKLANQIEPRLVVPIDYAVKGKDDSLRGPEQFLKEIGASGTEPKNKLTIKANHTFSEEETEAVVLKAS